MKDFSLRIALHVAVLCKVLVQPREREHPGKSGVGTSGFGLSLCRLSVRTLIPKPLPRVSVRVETSGS